MMSTKPYALCSSSAHNCSKLAITLLIAALAATLLLLSLTNSGQVAAQTGGTLTPSPTPDQPIDSSDQDIPPLEDKIDPPQYPNMDSKLNRIVERVQSGQFTAQAAAADAPVHSGASVAVTLYITEGYADAIAAYLTDNGASPRNIGVDYIEAYVPVSLLADASLQEGVISIRTIIPPQPAQGAVVSEGFWVHGVSSWRQAGYRGKGVKIGIIDAGFGGFDSLMGTELPSTVQARCHIEVGVFTSDLADCETGSHGTAVTEAIFDIAPEATYYISNAFAAGDLAKTTVDWMVEEGVDVINMSLGFSWDGRGDGTFYSSNSPLRSVEIAVANGITWANAAGNDALGTWFGSFTDSNGDGFHEFSGTDECNEIQVGGALFQLRWDDQWGGATIDLDLYLYDLDSGVHMGPLVSSNDVQSGAAGDIPYEELEFWTDHSGTYCLAVRHHSGDIPDWIQLTGWNSELEHHTLFGSIGNPAESASPGMLAVGAAPSDDIFEIEEFSSRGPTTDGRVKPDIVGADQGDSAVWGHWEGTSQASPHVAGLAALVKERFPDYSPAQIADYLKDHAEERGVPGPDNTWGYGFARLPALDEAPSVFIDRAALVAFYDATNGDNWTDNTDWLTDAHIYGWYGVTVNIDGSVTRLILEENNLVGNMPAELGDLSSLTELNLWNNRLTGDIPSELSNLTKLRTMDIGRNQLEGEIPPELGSISNLEKLWLDRNQLTGKIPVELSNLTDLTVLHVAENQLEGEIPAWLGDLPDLEELHLQDNQLTGSIPVELANLSDLDALFLADNQLTGCIPEGLRDIPDNDFADTGLLFCDEEPPDPCVEQLTGDGIVNGSWETGSECLSENRDGDGTGAYARYYTFTLAEQSDLTITLESTVDTYLYLLEGAGRDGEQIVENDDIDRDGDNYNSRIAGAFALGDYTIEATTYEAEVSGTFTLTVEGLGDSAIPPAPSSDREVLVALFEATDGPAWDDNGNWLTDAPLEDWHGIDTDDYGRVNELSLYDNNLSGHIPSELGNLTNLKESDLGKNHLSGQIPGELGNLSYLTSLLLDENELIGTIPPELGDLRKLETLYLNDNQLTGHIPSELGNLTELEELLLADNRLTGSIPVELGDLFNLEELHLQDNQLTGNIPAELANLSDLDALFLADNQLTGCIPESLRDIPDNDFDELGLPFCDDVQVPTDPCIERLTGDGIVNGSWETGSACVSENRDGDGTGAYARYYTFTLSEQSELTIVLESAEDPYLYLMEGEGRDGKQVSENDNIDVDGGNYNSSIEETLAPGDYTIEATTYETGVSGAFELTVKGLGNSGIPSDREALIALYHATNGENWKNNTNWLNDVPLGEWYGVTTNADGQVTELWLNDNGLTGPIPPEVGSLSGLQVLVLKANQLTGPIPGELANLANLQVLSLWHNRLEGPIPPRLGDLSNLRELWLHDNRLTGEIPAEFSRLGELQLLYLKKNQLTGVIPPQLGGLSELRHLWLHQNQFHGKIPTSLSNLANLEELDLGDNYLSGAIPPELGALANLERLSLTRNQLTGEIPVEFGRLGNLKSLALGGNSLEGSIPPEVGDIETLEFIFLGRNDLTGEIPAELGRLTNLGGLELHDNQLTGEVPTELGNLVNLWHTLDLSENRLTGKLPLNLTSLSDLFNLDFSYNYDLCASDEAAFQTWLQSVPQVRGDTCTDREALIALYDATEGNNWLNSAHWLTNAPVRDWHGVTTGVGDRVTRLTLDHNNLSGDIPIELADLTSLNHLSLTANSLTGRIPAELGDLSKLTDLRLAENQLAGEIPPGLGRLDSLRVLILYGNDLTGTIPPELGNLSSLRFLHLGYNRLSGEIPRWLGNLGQLEVVSLSDNQFTGTIPPELGDPPNLGKLLLSNNQFSGCIPFTLTDIPVNDLVELDLAFCDNPDRAILVALYHATGGDNWTNNTNWLTDAPLHKWHGVNTDNRWNVHELSLRDNQLTGQLPPELGELYAVKGLYFDNNQLTGRIPTQLGNLSRNLVTLWLHTNQFTGTIPAELANLDKLRDFNVSENELTGQLPNEFTGLKELYSLVFHSNAGLCAPTDDVFQQWLQTVDIVEGSDCTDTTSSSTSD